MKQPIVLRIFKGDKLYLVKQSTDLQVTIGREEQLVNLPGESTALLHASIQEQDGTYWLMDLGSETGTRRNGMPVLESQLESGDILEIGDYRIEFFIGAPRPRAFGETTGAGIPIPAPAAAPAPTPVAAPETVAPPIVVAPPPPPAAAPIAATTNLAIPTPVLTPATAPKPENKPEPKVAPVIPPMPLAEKPAAPRAAPVAPAAPPAPPLAAAPPAPVAPKSAPPKIVPPVLAPTPQPPSRRPSVSVGGIAAALRGKSNASGHKDKHKRWGRTFAAPSRYNEVTEYVKPGKGAVVEVLVAWQERILRTYHFSGNNLVTAGPNPGADVSLPIQIGTSDKTPILRTQGQAVVLLSGTTTGELVAGEQITPLAMLVQQRGLRPGQHGTELVLNQGEMIRLQIHEQVSLIIRYTSDSPKPLMAPAFDLTASESVGLIMAFVMTGILWLYMFLYTPPVNLADQANDEPLRQALIIVNPPKPPAPKVEPAATPEPTPPPVVKMTPTPKKTTTEPKKTTAAKQETTPSMNKPKGAASDVAPKPTKTKVKELTSVKQGGAVKTSKTEGAQMQAPKKDINKSSVFSAFASGGKNSDLSQATSGAGELAGMANAATGKAGSAEDRAGEGLGAKLKDTGAGGHGVAQVGMPGAKTHGRGGGDSGYGEGGLGGRKGVSIIPGGTGESFSPGYDKDAVRRVIQENINAIRACYERELNRSPDLQGKIVLQWSIGAGGRVSTGSIKTNEMGNNAVASCILARLKTLTFPDPPTASEVDVSYPFLFKN